VWCVYAIALSIGRQFWPALLVGAVWAVHPLGTEAITNIVGRADLLAAFGVLGAMYAHLREIDSRGLERWAWLAAVFAATSLGVFSKESAVAGIGVIVAYDLLWRANRSTLASIARTWIAPALAIVLFLMQRAIVLAGTSGDVPYVDNPIIGAGFWTGRLTALAVMGRYLGLFLWPRRLSADYSFPQIPLAHGSAGEWAAWSGVALIALLAVAMLRVHRGTFFCLAAAFITFLPASNLIFPTGTIMAERLMYLPSAFLCGAVVVGLYSFVAALQVRGLAPVLACVGLTALGIRTFERNADWRDEVTLWTATARDSPRSFKSHGALAEALYNADPTRGNLDRVIEEKDRSLALLAGMPDPAAVSKPYLEAATYSLERGDWLLAHRGVAAASDSASAYQKAASLGERYLALLAEHPVSTNDATQARLLVATAYDRLAKGDRAVDAARQAVALEPFNPVGYRASAKALLTAERQDEAAVELMTGFILTGNADLRDALVDVYRGGLDAKGCAVTPTAGGGVILNSSCEMVRRHLCAASARAERLQRDAGHADLAARIEASMRAANCSPL
jgi:protein O-mannosyl-transferase